MMVFEELQSTNITHRFGIDHGDWKEMDLSIRPFSLGCLKG